MSSMTFSTLHSVSAVLQSAGLLSVFLALLMLWIKLRKLNRENLPGYAPILATSGDSSAFHRTPIQATERLLIVLVIISGIAFIVGTGNFVLESYYSRVYEYHNVKLMKVVDDHTWILRKSDGAFRAEFCNDYDVSQLNPTPGEVLNKIRYIDMGTCWSVKRADLGFWWKRDANGWTIKESEDEQR